ncbi:MAG: hypothetical protein ACREBG_26330 [Pyrinomonadaceae bacterium]
MTNEFKEPVTRRLADFIVKIGLEIIPTSLTSKTFLPGILVENGSILVDESKLTYPGDLLHEAGHLAMAPSNIRTSLSGEVALPGVRMEPMEVSVIAWSYAAIVHLGLDPRVVFHEGGYGVESERLLNNYNLGVYIGANGLQDAGLTALGDNAKELGVPPYPHMLKWLRD